MPLVLVSRVDVCPYCGGSVILSDRGEYVCSRCGVVLEDHPVNYGLTRKQAVGEEGVIVHKYMLPNMGIGTIDRIPRIHRTVHNILGSLGIRDTRVHSMAGKIINRLYSMRGLYKIISTRYGVYAIALAILYHVLRANGYYYPPDKLIHLIKAYGSTTVQHVMNVLALLYKHNVIPTHRVSNTRAVENMIYRVGVMLGYKPHDLDKLITIYRKLEPYMSGYKPLGRVFIILYYIARDIGVKPNSITARMVLEKIYMDDNIQTKRVRQYLITYSRDYKKIKQVMEKTHIIDK